MGKGENMEEFLSSPAALKHHLNYKNDHFNNYDFICFCSQKMQKQRIDGIP